MGPTEIIIGVSMMSAMTVMPNVIARLIKMGAPQIIMTFGLRCSSSMASETRTILMGSILSTSSM